MNFIKLNNISKRPTFSKVKVGTEPYSFNQIRTGLEIRNEVILQNADPAFLLFKYMCNSRQMGDDVFAYLE